MATKPWYAWATPSGLINLMKAEDMPVKPIQTNAWNGKDYRENAFNNSQQFHYEQALQAAKESSVPIQDQVKAIKMIMLFQGISTYYTSIEELTRRYLKPDTIYGPFTVKYRIEDACAHDSCPVDAMCEHCKEPVKVAILYDDTEKDHDTVLKEFADKMSKQEDIPKDIQAVVNKRFWDMLDTPEKEESQEDMLLEIFEDYKLLNISRDKEQFRAFIAMELSKFTITRKQ